MDRLKENIDRIFKEKEEQNKGIKILTKNQRIVWKDIVQAKFPLPEQKWVLNFNYDDFPDWLLNIQGRNASIECGNVHKKFFVVRDIYKYLSKPEYRFEVSPAQSWWLQVLLDSNLDVLRSITLGKPFLSRQLANFLGVMIDPYINKVNKQILRGLEEQNLLDKTSPGTGNKDQPIYLEKLRENPDLDRIVDSLKQELNLLPERLITAGIQKSMDTASFVFKPLKPYLQILPPSILNHIQTRGHQIAGYFQSIERTQHILSIPQPNDYNLADDLLFLDRLTQGFTGLDRRQKIMADLYIDFSGSMQDKIGKDCMKSNIALGFVLQLKKYNVKFRNIYGFNAQLERITYKELFNRRLSRILCLA